MFQSQKERADVDMYVYVNLSLYLFLVVVDLPCVDPVVCLKPSVCGEGGQNGYGVA
jgi:hypothetical protein